MRVGEVYTSACPPARSTTFGCCLPDGADGGVEMWYGVRIPDFRAMTRAEAFRWRGDDDGVTDEDDSEAESLTVRRRLMHLHVFRGGIAPVPDLLSDERAQTEERAAVEHVRNLQRNEAAAAERASEEAAADARKAAKAAKRKARGTKEARAAAAAVEGARWAQRLAKQGKAQLEGGQ